jgi:hypothetical protein
MDKREFINSIKEGALKGQSVHRILPSLTIAQAILESGWGSSELAQRANNLFGIKAFSTWKGKRITMPTTEWHNDQRRVVNAEFRAYDSFNGSIEDHNMLLSNSRYKPVRGCGDYKEACKKIYECGYATDPDYTGKLVKIIEENKLYEFDSAPVIEEVAASTVGEKIRKFQQLCNRLNIKDSEGNALVEDNILGPKTRSCIDKMPTLKVGSSGLAVEFVQEVVNADPVDGDFGPITRKCVIEYQRGKNIVVDGIVGKETWAVIVTT